ncbi:MAG: DUF2961 domain-containing protein [Bacteroidia bacterium]|nr:DUF2961 domain-containing protein [Bacteroidia bacterium]
MRSLLLVFLAGITAYSCSRETPDIRISDDINEHSLITELEVFHNPGKLSEYIENAWCAQVSSWDTTGKNDDGFSGTYSFIKRNDDGSLLIFDVEGKGVINRIWTPTPNNDTLDFYIDNNEQPSFSISFIDLFSGKVFPFTLPLCGNQLGGYYCYVPITFSKSCRIISRGNKIQFHQIQYRLYNDRKNVIPFNLNLKKEEKETLDKIAELWNSKSRNVSDFFKGELESHRSEFILKPGNSQLLFQNSSGGRIAGIELTPSEAFEGWDKNTDIKITWDTESSPAIYCPVADFFGYAFGTASMQSLLLGSSGNMNYCYFPMPFDKSASIEIICRKVEGSPDSENKISATIWYSKEKRNPEKEGKFYAFWHKNSRTTKGIPHLLAEIKGKGQYVGTILQAQGLKAGMTLFFEGDDSTSVDGTFRMHGTGSEDYFNGGWYAMLDRWDGRMSLPLHGSLDYSLPFCRTGGYRLFVSDRISFEKSFYHSIEHGPVGNAFPADFTSIGLYYCDSPPENIIIPTNELTTVFIPDTLILYPQLLELTLYGSIDIKTTWKYGTGGESYLFRPGGDSWVRISLRDIPEGNYSMYFDIMKEPDGCDFSVWHRQSQLTDWISGYSRNEERVNNQYICDLDLDHLNNTITTRFRTGDGRTGMLLNRIMLIRKN